MLRDDIPTIPAPNCWSLIGGAEEEDETPEQTLLREMKEEANIDPLPARLLWQWKHRWYYHVALPDQVLDTVKLGDEGQKLGYFTLDQLKQIQLTPSLTQMLDDHQEEIAKLLNPLNI